MPLEVGECDTVEGSEWQLTKNSLRRSLSNVRGSRFSQRMEFNNPRLLRRSGSCLPNSVSQLVTEEGDDLTMWSRPGDRVDVVWEDVAAVYTKNMCVC